MGTCHRCGARTGTDPFCVACGAPTRTPAPAFPDAAPANGVRHGVAAGPVLAPPPVPWPPPPPLSPAGPVPPAASAPTTSRPASTVFLAVAAVLLLLLGGGVGFALGRGTGGSAALAAPQLLGPSDGSVFDHFPRDLDLTWAPVADAASYTVEFQYLNGGSRPDDWRPMTGGRGVTPGVTATTFPTSFVGAQPGRWRVTAVGRDGVAGPPSAWSGFEFLR